MSRTSVVAPRKLSPAEVRAVDLSRRNATLRSIIIQTGLSEQQIKVALEHQSGWDALHAETARSEARDAARRNPMPSREPDLRPLSALVEAELVATEADDAVPEVPDVLPVPVDEPVAVDWEELLADTPGEGLVPAETEPAAVDLDELIAEEFGSDEPPAEEDRLYIEEPEPIPDAPDAAIERLLSRAEASLQPRVRQLAGDVRRQLTELEQLLGQDEQVRVLTIAAEVLRSQLADTEAKLADLLGAEIIPVPPAATKPAAVKVAITPPPKDGTLAYSTTVRQWAAANGWDVKPFGRMPGAVVTAYEAAMKGTS